MSEIVDDGAELDLIVNQIARTIKPAFVSALYLTACAVFGAPLWKAAIVALAVFILQLLHLGTRRLQQLGFLLAVLIGMYWIDIVPLQKWAGLLNAKIETILTRP